MTSKKNAEANVPITQLFSLDHLKRSVTKLNKRIADLKALESKIEKEKTSLTEAEIKGAIQEVNTALLDIYGNDSKELKESKINYFQVMPQSIKHQSHFGRKSAHAEEIKQQQQGIEAIIVRLKTHLNIFSERIAELDPAQVHVQELTGLPSLKQFELDLLAMAQKPAQPFTLAFLDIDNFKQINTDIGHDKADDIIKHLAKFLVHVTKGRAAVYHRSGDEFLMILENSDAKESQLFLTRAIAGVKQENFPHLGKKISVSIGAAAYPEHATEPDMLKEQSNAAMRKAKEKKGIVALFSRPAAKA